MAFGLELMGAKDVRNYYRGWDEWGNSEDTPVTVPKKAKQEERHQTRRGKDFQRADALRDQLQSMGVQLADAPSGTRYKMN